MAQAGSGHARHAPGDRSRPQGLLAGNGLLWTAEYRFYRTGESDRPSWRLSSGTPHLGHREACPTAARSRGMVASVLSLRAPPCITSSGARAAGSRVEASWWRNAIGNERKLWQPGEPIDDGRRMRCSLTPCCRFPLKRHRSQRWLQCHGVWWCVKRSEEEVEWPSSRLRWLVRNA